MATHPAKKKKRRKSAAVPAFAPQRLTEREKIIAGGVFFVAAFVIRLAYILLSRDQPTFEALAMDPLYHHDVAVTIANGDWLAGDEPLYRSPFYMYVLALVYKIFGVGYMVPRVFGAFTGSVSVVLILLIGDKLFGRRAALIAGVFALLFWPLIYFDGELLTTSFTVMMGLVLIVLFIRAYESPTVRRLVILGLFFGLMAITRENYLPIIGLAFLFWVVLLRRLLSPTLFLVSAVAVVSLITLRNYVVLNDFVPITHYTGVNFYIGNNPFSDGRTAVLPCVRASWWGGVEDTKAVAEAHTQSSLKPSGINAFWFGETLNYIGSNFASCTRETALLTPTVDGKRSCGFKPGSQCVSFLEGATRKAFYVVDPFEFSNNKELYFIRDLSPVIGFPLLWLFANLTAIPLGFVGMYFAWRDRQRKALPLAVILVGYAIGLSLGFVNTRIRMPMTVLWIIFFRTCHREFVDAPAAVENLGARRGRHLFCDSSSQSAPRRPLGALHLGGAFHPRQCLYAAGGIGKGGGALSEVGAVDRGRIWATIDVRVDKNCAAAGGGGDGSGGLRVGGGALAENVVLS